MACQPGKRFRGQQTKDGSLQNPFLQSGIRKVLSAQPHTDQEINHPGKHRIAAGHKQIFQESLLGPEIWIPDTFNFWRCYEIELQGQQKSGGQQPKRNDEQYPAGYIDQKDRDGKIEPVKVQNIRMPDD